MFNRKRSGRILFGIVFLFLTLFVSGFTRSLAATDSTGEYLLQAWQTEDGLPQQVVNTLLQDHDGYLWLATESALVRFDGIQFKEFTSPLIRNEKTSKLRALAQEDADTLLIAPDIGGLVRLKHGQFSVHPASALLTQQSISTLFPERSGALWIGYLSGDVVRWEKGRITSFGVEEGFKGQWCSFAYDQNGALWLANGNFLTRYESGRLIHVKKDFGDKLCIAPSRVGGLWIASNDRLCLFQNGKTTLEITAPPWTGVRVRSVFEDRNGGVWIGTSAKGLFRCAAGEFTAITTSHPSINAVCDDFEGNIWVATHGGGLNRLRPRFFHFYDSRNGLPENISYSLCEDFSKRIWIANCDGGLARVNGGAVEVLTRRKDWPALRVFSVSADATQQIWIGTRLGLYRWKMDSDEVPTRLEEDQIKDVHVLFSSRNGDTWVGADAEILGRFRGDQFRRFTAADGFTGGNVRAICDGRKDQIWIGTDEGSLFSVQGDYVRRYGTAEGLTGGAIGTIHCDGSGVLWIGLSSGGLLIQLDDRFVSVDAADGFPANGIFQILSDERGRMWFGSPAGIFHVSREELLACARNQTDRVHPVLMGRSDGLSSVSCIGAYQPTSLKSSSGQLWFATRQGLVEVDTAAEHLNSRPPPVFISECLLDDHSMRVEKGMKVAPGVRKLEMRFSVLSYTAPEKVQVRHFLEGFDSDWVEDGGTRRAVFPKLQPGNYRLRVVACNNDGVWNEKGAELAFTVLPAWWQTTLFRLMAVSGFAVMVGASVRYWSNRRLRLRLERLEQQQALEKERARIARDLHDDLGANLTQIALLAEMSSGDSISPERARNNSTQLSQTARTLVRELDNILWTVNPKNDSLDQLATYLCQFSQQFFRVTPVRCRFDVAENLPKYLLTPEVRHDVFLVVKEAMNNITKYSGATEVWLRIAMRDMVFRVEIEDNGSGFDLETALKSGRNGLANMRARMEGIGGNLNIEAQSGKGMRLYLELPLKSDSRKNI